MNAKVPCAPAGYPRAPGGRIVTGMTTSFEGKVALVTGAASGIGKATVELFRSEGATVIAVDATEGADVVMDAGNEADVRALVDRVAREHGGLDIFFANAGISGGFASITEQTAEDWAEILRINLIGPFLAVKYAAPAIAKRGGGSIICTASVAGLRSGAGGAAYSASKAGVINLVQTSAQQLTGSGVRVNAICPGTVETPFVEGYLEKFHKHNKEEIRAELRARQPIGRLGRPDEIASMVRYLASTEAAFINGSIFTIDGGWTAA